MQAKIFLHLKPMFGTMGKHSTVNISHLLAASCLLLPHSSATQPPYLLLKDYAHITLKKSRLQLYSDLSFLLFVLQLLFLHIPQYVRQV